MEALINFQTMCADLTGMEIANASLLDEATAAAEAMTLAKRSAKSKSNTFFVSGDVHPQTLEVLQHPRRAAGHRPAWCARRRFHAALAAGDYFGVLLQYPGIQRLDRRLDQAMPTPIHAHSAPVRRRHRPAGADPAQVAGRDGAPTSSSATPSASACRSASAARMPRSWPAGRLQALDAGPPDRRVHRRRRQAGLPPHAADARAAHPPREGHVQHLHRAGAAGGDGLDVRGLPRPGWPDPHRPPRRIA